MRCPKPSLFTCVWKWAQQKSSQEKEEKLVQQKCGFKTNFLWKWVEKKVGEQICWQKPGELRDSGNHVDSGGSGHWWNLHCTCNVLVLELALYLHCVHTAHSKAKHRLASKKYLCYMQKNTKCTTCTFAAKAYVKCIFCMLFININMYLAFAAEIYKWQVSQAGWFQCLNLKTAC